jgi:hypothetical protein
MSTPVLRPTQSPKTAFGFRMLQVGAVERIGIEKDGHSIVERDTVLCRVGLRLSWIPLEHAFSIYESAAPWPLQLMRSAIDGAVNNRRTICSRIPDNTAYHGRGKPSKNHQELQPRQTC